MKTHRAIVLQPPRRTWTLGGVRVHEVTYAPGEVQPEHRHASASVSLVLRGGIHERGDRVDAHAGACSVIVKPSGTPHACTFGSHGAQTLVVEFAGDYPGIRAHAYHVHQQSELAAAGLALREALSVQQGAAAALRAYIHTLSEHAPPDVTGGDDWLTRVRQELDADDAPSGAELAARAGVHVASLSRAFRRRFGVGISRYRQHQRVLRAVRLVADSAQPLAAVAVDAGFADQSHLTRAFRAELGTTPGRYRRSLVTAG